MPGRLRPLLLDDRRRPRRRTTSTSSSPRSRRRGSRVEQYYAELGHGQQEISTAHAPALQAADEQLLVRETIRGVASRRGLVASLAPKPWPDNAGNGCHIHFSLWDGDGRNRFYDAAAPTALGRGRAFLAGVLDAPARPVRADRAELQLLPAHRPAVLGRRVHLLGPRQPRGAAARAVRRSAAREEASTNVELKAADATLQPVPRARRADRRGARRDRARARAARAGRASTRPRSTRTSARRAGSRRLPATQAEALDALAARRRARSARSARCSRSPTSPSAARSGRPTPRGTRHSSSRVTSRSTERGRGSSTTTRTAILREPPATLDEFRGLFSESADPRQWPHVATARHVPARDPRAGGASSAASRPRRPCSSTGSRTDPREYAAALLRATGHRGAAPRRRLPAGRRERQLRARRWGSSRAARRGRCCASSGVEEALDGVAEPRSRRRARGDGFVALKTIAAYRGGLASTVGRPDVLARAGGQRGHRRPAAGAGPHAASATPTSRSRSPIPAG